MLTRENYHTSAVIDTVRVFPIKTFCCKICISFSDADF